MPVICNQRHGCHMGDECGGAVPHQPCPECGKCPSAERLGARCIDVDLDTSDPKIEREKIDSFEEACRTFPDAIVGHDAVVKFAKMIRLLTMDEIDGR